MMFSDAQALLVFKGSLVQAISVMPGKVPASFGSNAVVGAREPLTEK